MLHFQQSCYNDCGGSLVFFSLSQCLKLSGILRFVWLQRPTTPRHPSYPGKSVLQFCCFPTAPLHTGRGLHLTLIRNEAAYFACIHQVLTSCDPISPPTEGEKRVYFIGDSHCSTPAWRHINIKVLINLIYLLQ